MTRRRVSRRRLLGGTAAAFGAAAAGGTIFALSRGDDGTARKAGTPTASTSPSATTATPSPTPVPQGGIARIVSAGRFNFDTFDAQRSGEPSVIEVLGRTHSRLVDWGNFDDPKLVAGLAASWEQPDDRSLVLHLDPRAMWHGTGWRGTGAIGPRRVTAEDIVLHLDRAMALARGKLPLAQRAGDYRQWSRVFAPDAATVVIEAGAFDPFSLHTLAGRFALVQAPEAVSTFEGSWHELRPDSLVGSCAFRFKERGKDGVLSFDAAHGGHREPNLSGIEVFESGSADELLAMRRDEWVARDRRDALALRKEPRLVEEARYEDSPVISTFFTGAPPWNNPDLVRAISAALNRNWLSEQLFGGRADVCGPVSPASGAFALPAAALQAYPGYAADPDTDARLARALWDRAGGPGLGTVTIDFPSIFDPLYSASSVVVGRLNQVLGQQFRAAVETYTTISSKTAERRYGNGRAAFWFGWGTPLLEPDPSRALIETYFSGGPNAELLGVQPSKVDLALAAITDPASPVPQRTRAHVAQEAVLAVGGLGVVSWLLQRSERFRWPYWQGAPASPFWTQHLDHAAYLDPGAEGFISRPA